ncbi:MAG: 50S ribosomal protein L24 [Firmicutes bacterium]|nr:50S ribosomal protein L24 [Bacillota bacterium]
MKNKVHVKAGDLVYVLTGKNEGKRGRVLKVYPAKGKVTVENVNVVKRHTKPRRINQQGGIIDKEAPIDSSNVMLVCPRCDKPTKIAKSILDKGQKARVCKKCNEIIDIIKDAKQGK